MGRILLMEPDTILGKTYKHALEEDNHEVLWVKSAAKALAWLDEAPVDVIVMELLLGRNNGIEFLYEIRSYADLRTVPVVVHSSADPTLFQQSPSYKTLNVHTYLYKPDSQRARLRETINAIIDTSTVKTS